MQEARIVNGNGKRRKRHSTKLSLKRVIRAVKNSYGQPKKIYKRLGITHGWWCNYLRDKAPEVVKDLLQQEKDRIKDAAENTILDMIRQRIHFPSALRASEFILDRKGQDRGYGYKKELTLQGGNKPIQLQNKNIMSIDRLKNIPLDVRKKILEEMREEGEEKKE